MARIAVGIAQYVLGLSWGSLSPPLNTRRLSNYVF
jgi:hypothetical protein